MMEALRPFGVVHVYRSIMRRSWLRTCLGLSLIPVCWRSRGYLPILPINRIDDWAQSALRVNRSAWDLARIKYLGQRPRSHRYRISHRRASAGRSHPPVNLVADWGDYRTRAAR